MWAQALSGIVGLAIVLGGVTVAALVAKAVSRHPAIGLGLVFVFCTIAWEVPAPSLGSFAGGQIKPEDLVFGVLILAAFFNSGQLRATLRGRWRLLTFTGIAIASSVILGMLQNGAAAYNEARIVVWLAAAIAWVLSVDWHHHRRQLDTAMAVGGLILLAVLAYHTARYGLGSADSFVVTGDGGTRTNRPLVSGQAMMLGLMGLYWLAHDGRDTSWRSFAFGSALLTGAILCQHRSVWVALCVAGVCLLATLRGKALGTAVFLGFYAAVTALLIISATPAAETLKAVVESFRYSATNTGTLSAREGSFTVLVGQSIERGPAVVLFGQPYGSGWDHVVDGQLITFGPHNWYLMSYLRVGLVGVFLIVALLAIVLIRLVSARQVRWSIILVALLVYSGFYATEWYLALPLGLAIGASLTAERSTSSSSPHAQRIPTTVR